MNSIKKSFLGALALLMAALCLAACSGAPAASVAPSPSAQTEGTPLFAFCGGALTGEEQPLRATVRYISEVDLGEFALTEPEAAKALLRAAARIRVGAQTDICVTDAAQSVTFFMADGAEYRFSFEGPYLHYNDLNYEVTDSAELFGMTWELATNAREDARK